MSLTPAKLKKLLLELDDAELRQLVAELAADSAEVRHLLSAKLAADRQPLLDALDRELAKAFGGKNPSMKVAAAKKALNTALKDATPQEALEARLTYVEAGVRCYDEWGDMEPSAINSVESVWTSLLEDAARLPLHELPLGRLERVARYNDMVEMWLGEMFDDWLEGQAGGLG